jgi:hypothetical protein
LLDDDLRFLEAVEDLTIEQFITQLSMAGISMSALGSMLLKKSLMISASPSV